MNNNKEEWRGVVGAESLYQVSSFGRIKRLDRLDSVGRKLKGRMLSGSIKSGGYIAVNIIIDGVKNSYRLHQIIAVAFLGHIICGHEMVINHIDGDKLNNNIDNLEIVTTRENSSTCHRRNEESYSSIYVGVSWAKERQKWLSAIRIDGRKIYLGLFDLEIDAHYAYQEALKNEHNPEYFEALKPKHSSKYKYIYFDNRTSKWRARWKVDKEMHYIGCHDTESEAYTAQQDYLTDRLLTNS